MNESFNTEQSTQTNKPLISVVVPAYNEADVIQVFYERMCKLFDSLSDYCCEMIIVNDGSQDLTQSIIEQLRSKDNRIASISLTRNFGKEIAMTAGLDHAKGDAIIIIDVDLQDPPELIVKFIEEWQNGYDIVYARRTARDGETWLKIFTAEMFYKVMDKISERVKIPRNTGDFRLMSRRSVDALLQLREHHRFMKGLYAWVGFPSKAIDYRRDPRAAGSSKFNYWSLWNFALEGITSFTVIPLKIATYLGLLTSLSAFSFGLFIIIKTLLWGDSVQGFPTLMVTILFLGGVQLFFIGVMGEYLGRIFGETKQRPLYLIQRYSPSHYCPVEQNPTPSAKQA